MVASFSRWGKEMCISFSRWGKEMYKQDTEWMGCLLFLYTYLTSSIIITFNNILQAPPINCFIDLWF